MDWNGNKQHKHTQFKNTHKLTVLALINLNCQFDIHLVNIELHFLLSNSNETLNISMQCNNSNKEKTLQRHNQLTKYDAPIIDDAPMQTNQISQLNFVKLP